MRKMEGKLKRRLKIALGIAGTTILVGGASTMLTYAAKTADVEREKIAFANQLGYQQTKAKEKANKVTNLTIQMLLKEITPEQFIDRYNTLEELSEEDFIRNYTDAEAQEKYSALVEKSQNYLTIAHSVGLPAASVGSVLLAGGAVSLSVKGPSKREVEAEEASSTKPSREL